MTRARAIANAADRRLWLSATLRAGGRCITIAAATAAAAVAADRVLGVGAPLWAIVGIAAVGAIGGTALLAARDRARQGKAAVVLDHALGLRDRVSSSLALERTDDDHRDPFLALAQRDADAAARDADVRRAIPLRFDNWWAFAPVAAAGLVLAALFVPVFDVLGARERSVEQAALAERRDAAAEAIEQLREELRAATAHSAADAASPEQLEALEDLERELAQGDIDPDDARAKAASRLDDLAEGLDDLADRDDRALDALGERFASLDQRTDERAATQSLEDALRRGDWDRAAEALEQLQRDAARDSSLSDADRARLADDLRDLSRALEQAGAQPPPAVSDPDTPTDASSTRADDLREHGVPSDLARELADSQDADALRDSLENNGMPPEQADRLARRIADENRARAAEARADDDLRDLADALEETADDALNPPQHAPPPTPSPTQTTPDEPARPGEPPETQPRPSDPQRTPSGGEDRPRNPRDPSQQESEKDPGAPQRQPQQGPAQDVGADQGDDNTGADEQGRKVDDAQRPDAQPQPGSQGAEGSSRDDAASPSEQPSTPGAQQSQRDASGRGAAQDSPVTRPGAAASEDAPDDAEPGAMDGPAQEGNRSSQGQANRGAQRALDKVRELAHRRSSAQQSREEAERLRRRAEEMLEQLSPEERDELRRLAEQMARERGTPTEDLSDAPSETVDARRPSQRADDQGRVIAEWLTQGRTGADDSRGAVNPDRRIAEAAQGAQRAIEEQRTPARYADLIRRYFDRLPDAVRRTRDGAAPSAPDAPDVAPNGTRG